MSNKKVLIVEDDPAIIDIYFVAFRKVGIDLQVIDRGGDAIIKIKSIIENKEELPELVLLDLILPDVNGIEVLKEIKMNDFTKHTPVFILSNNVAPEMFESAEFKPDKIIIKSSVALDRLVGIVKKQLKVK